MSLRIGIIGPARGQDLTLQVWEAMLKELETLLTCYLKSSSSDPVTLVSGGAAFFDHSAVIMAKKFNLPLELHLPCEWDKKKRQFQDNGIYDWKTNPGSLTNKLHRDFSKVTGLSSLQDLDSLMQTLKCKVQVHKGFHARNLAIGKVNILIAFCRGQSKTPQSKGTYYTWSKSSAPKKIAIAITE